MRKQFADFATYSAQDKTAISVRDGVLEYLGSELGLDPSDKVFTVYRSPATIANAAASIVGVPLTDEHVSLDVPPPDTGSNVVEATMIDQIDEPTHSRIAVKNKLKVSDTFLPVLDDKKELSLGYYADLIPHSEWDFEQINIQPHHLAAVPAGRCGPLCSFLDRKPQHMKETPEMLNKAFCDAEGAVSLEQIVEIATALPEAIKKVPVDQLENVLPALQEILSYAKSQGAEMPETAEEEMPTEDEGGEDKEVMDEDVEVTDEDTEEDKPKFSDADFKKALSREKVKFADEQVKLYASVVNKARDFMDASYDFEGKTAKDIMRDVLDEYTGEKFSDAELNTAFRLLKKQGDYKKFGDAAKHPLDELKNKELG